MKLDFDFLRCKIGSNSFTRLDTSLSVEKLDSLGQLNDDMFIGEYPNGLSLSIDWSSFESFTSDQGPYILKGFIVSLARSYDWNFTVLRWLARDFDELIDVLKRVDDWAMSVKS